MNSFLQVAANVGDGAVGIDEYGYNSLEHLATCNAACNQFLPPPPHMDAADQACRICKGLPAILAGDECQHTHPTGTAVHKGAAAYLADRTYVPPPKDRRPDANHEAADRTVEGFKFVRAIAQHVVPLTVVHRQDSSPRGIQLQKDILLFNGRQTASESAVKAFLVRLDACVIDAPASLAPYNPRIVLQRNAPRHRLNTRLIQHQAAHLKLRLTVWNARHHPVRPRNGPEPPPLTRLEHEAALRTADAAFKHLTADTWYFPGALFTHHGNGGTDAGACNNSLVRAVGLLTDPREPPDNGQGPHRRLQFMPLAVFIKPVNVAIPANIAGAVTAMNSLQHRIMYIHPPNRGQ